MHSPDPEKADAGYFGRGCTPQLDSACPSRKNLSDAPTTPSGPMTPRCCDQIILEKVKVDGEDNCGAVTTRAQQGKILIATSLVTFWVLGLTQSFGIWQRHYGSEAAVKDGIITSSEMTQRGAIAAIGSLGNGGLVAAFGMLYYPFLPRIGQHVKTICSVGTLLTAGGFALATTGEHLWVLLLTQGMLVGTGGGIMFYTLTPILPEYFGRHSGLAQGISVAGASVGGTTLSLAIPKLLEEAGTRWTLGFLSLLSIVVGSLISLLAQPPRKFDKRSREVVGWRAFKDPSFTLLFLVNLCHPLTLANPMTFGPEFSEALGFSARMGAILLAIGSAVGFPARLVNGFVADLVGHQNMLILATAVYAMGAWGLWLSAAHTDNRGLWIAFNVIYGIVNGTFNTVINSVQKMLFGSEQYFPRNGVMTSIRGVGYVLGVPIVGSLVSRVKDIELDGDDFTRPIVYTGLLLTVSVLCLAGIRGLDARKNGWRWVR